MTRRRLNLSSICLAFIGLLLIFGCAKQIEDDSFQLTGTVIYKGKPVPKGNIFFEPDTAQGNSGPQGFADIVNGEFDTTASGGTGGFGGAYIIRIQGYDGVVDGDSPFGRALFPEYTLKMELPNDDKRIEFVVREDKQSSQR